MEARFHSTPKRSHGPVRRCIPLTPEPRSSGDRHLGRRASERQAQSRVLHDLTGQHDPTAALIRIVDSVERLLEAQAGLCLPDQVDGEPGGPFCVVAAGADACTGEGPCPVRDSRHPIRVPLRHFGRPEGYLWVLLPEHRSLSEHDQHTLATFAELAVFTLNQAVAVREERHDALLGERDRIAREMHDSLAQVLGVTQLRLAALSQHPHLADQDEIRHELGDLVGICRDAYADVREAILGLRESTRPNRSFLEKLEHYTELFARRSGVDAVVLNLWRCDPELTPQAEAQAFRIVQEALNNVRKHAGATTAILRLSESGDGVYLTVEDDGRGFDTDALPGESTFGLRAMAERASLIGGRVKVASHPGEGTTVTLTVPTVPGLGNAASNEVAWR